MLHLRRSWLRAALLSSCQTAFGSIVPFLEQSFFFDWNTPGQRYPVPVTQQCETISITWERGSATGPNPVSPYYLQVYTSTFVVPFIIPVGDVLQYDWTVPFAPGTLYQICMFDKNGNTGGCQDVYTVIPGNVSSPSCANVTFPSPLAVDAMVENGPMSQFGWVNQCTDITLTPRNGTPPYTMTVAPTLHPPYNITSDGQASLNWTVSLSWGSSFFLSVVDGAGSVWSNGLLHSGGNGSTACLTGMPPGSSHGSGVTTGIAIGAGVGGLGVGLLVGLLSSFIFFRCRNKRKRSESALDLHSTISHPTSPHGFHSPLAAHYHAVSASSSGIGVMDSSLAGTPMSNGNRVNGSPMGQQYHIEPFIIPPATEDGRLQNREQASSTYQSHSTKHSFSNLLPTAARNPSPSRPTSSGSSRQVYVVHHDGGPPPVTVYTEEGAQVVELPPDYPGNPNPERGPGEVRPVRATSPSLGNTSLSDGGRSNSANTHSSGAALPQRLQQPRRPTKVRKTSVTATNRLGSGDNGSGPA